VKPPEGSRARSVALAIVRSTREGLAGDERVSPVAVICRRIEVDPGVGCAGLEASLAASVS
jgi:hypothetical protein